MSRPSGAGFVVSPTPVGSGSGSGFGSGGDQVNTGLMDSPGQCVSEGAVGWLIEIDQWLHQPDGDEEEEWNNLG